MDIEWFIINFSYLGIFISMIFVGFFGIFPPSKVIYVLSGYFAYKGEFSLFNIILVGALGHTLGNYIQYEFARQKGLNYISKFKLFPKKEILKLQIAFNNHGIWFLFLGKLFDPIKLFISICAGIAKMNRLLFLTVVFLASAIWATVFSYIGFYFGKSYSSFGYIGVFALFLVGIVVIICFYKFMNSEKIVNMIENKID